MELWQAVLMCGFVGMNTGLKFGLDPKVLNGNRNYYPRASTWLTCRRRDQCFQRPMLELHAYEPS